MIITRKGGQKKLKIDNHLPQIIIPANKIDMFVQWWNSDIRFEKTIPHSFESGYLKIERLNNPFSPDDEKLKALIKSTAKNFHMTYRQVESELKAFLDKPQSAILYFSFVADNKLHMELYDATSKDILANSDCEFGESEPEEEYHDGYIPEVFKGEDYFQTLQNQMNYQNMLLLITSLWYIATTTHTTKYIYEEKHPVVIGRHKDVVKVSSTKTIDTPIYDMRKIRTVKVETLQARKKGWTYSHSFQVHGHYRHYKNGKVIFVNSFIKGKDKEFKAQEIRLEPKAL